MTTDPVAGYLDEISAVLRRIVSVQVQGLLDVGVWTKNATVFVCGKGDSASSAFHMATDLANKTAVGGRRCVKAVALTDSETCD
jgi:phosphoheptose isomerase